MLSFRLDFFPLPISMGSSSRLITALATNMTYHQLSPAFLNKRRVVSLLHLDLFYITPSRQKSDMLENRRIMTSNLDRTHRFRDGRRYHAFDEGVYYFPYDEAEASSLDKTDWCLRFLFCW